MHTLFVECGPKFAQLWPMSLPYVFCFSLLAACSASEQDCSKTDQTCCEIFMWEASLIR